MSHLNLTNNTFPDTNSHFYIACHDVKKTNNKCQKDFTITNQYRRTTNMVRNANKANNFVIDQEMWNI